MKNNLIGKLMLAATAAATLAACATSHKKEYLAHEFWTYSPDGKIIRHEVWTENHHGGGTAILSDPVATQIASYHTNQAALGGSSAFTVGNVQATVSTNAVGIISAGGSAIGNVIGAALKSASGVPSVSAPTLATTNAPAQK